MKKREYELNGLTLEINMNDADFAKKYEEAFEALVSEGNQIGKMKDEGKKQHEIITAYCNAFYHLFDNIFGPGTGDKLFGGKHDAGACEEVYGDFLEICRTQTAEAKKRRESIIAGNFRREV